MTKTRKGLGIVIFAALLQTVYAQEPKHHFAIPAQSLDSALETLANQSGAQMLYAEQSAAGKTSRALEGDYTVKEAVGKMLLGTDLNYQVAENGTVTVKPAARSDVPAKDTALGKVTVSA
ncbi:MAG: STN domain-containing protein, partial [Methylococcales bacterium]